MLCSCQDPRRHLGGVRPFRTHFHTQEKKWLYDEHVSFAQERRASNAPVDFTRMKWADLATRFNHRFAGKVLPGVADPRPSRTASALRTERSRIPNIKMYMRRMSHVSEDQTIVEKRKPETESRGQDQGEGQEVDKGDQGRSKPEETH